MVKYSGQWIPVCYAMLPDKSKESYFTMFQMLKLYMDKNGLAFNVESMRMDFEIASMKAVIAAWAVLVKGCYFHFSNAGWRFVQNNNMAHVYLNGNDEDFNVFVKSVLALPHVKLADLQETVELLAEKEWKFEEDDDKAEFKRKFLNYIQDNWIDGSIPPQVWNCHNRKVDLTNNNNEGHNSYLNNVLKELHPSPTTLAVAIVKELTMAETTFRRFQNGAKREVRREYRKLNIRRKVLKNNYPTMDRLQYLSRMGNIVIHFHLNKGQLAIVRDRNDRDQPEHVTNTRDTSNLDFSDDSYDDPARNVHDTHDRNVHDAPDRNVHDDPDRNVHDDPDKNVHDDPDRNLHSANENEDSSDADDSGEDDTKSLLESNNPYSDRHIGKVKDQEVQYGRLEYLKKRCMVCNGRFNKRSKYQVCKLCDKLIHVNNNRKCMKMRHYKRDDDFICQPCASKKSSGADSALDQTKNNPEHEPNLNSTYVLSWRCKFCGF